MPTFVFCTAFFTVPCQWNVQTSIDVSLPIYEKDKKKKGKKKKGKIKVMNAKGLLRIGICFSLDGNTISFFPKLKWYCAAWLKAVEREVWRPYFGLWAFYGFIAPLGVSKSAKIPPNKIPFIDIAAITQKCCQLSAKERNHFKEFTLVNRTQKIFQKRFPTIHSYFCVEIKKILNS